jgi:SAM-dependent methyltransferase
MDLMTGKPRGRIVEIGCGSGALLREFAERGFETVGVETSQGARKVAELFADGVAGMQVLDAPSADWTRRFDYLFSFEVLEHIEKDADALRSWVDWLKPRGLALISVPAHMRLWGPSDVFAGHFRRYSRPDVIDLLGRAGLVPVLVEAYGFPLSNLIEPIRNRHHARMLREQDLDTSKREATARSGIERTLETRLFPLMSRAPGRQAFRVALLVQRWFRNTGLGTGFLAVGQRA